MKSYKEKELTNRTVFDGKCIKVKTYDVQLSNGDKGYREIIHHPGGVVVVAQKDKNTILMVRQYRFAINQESLELPAGRLERGENPDEAIKRELEEETGYNAKIWKSLGYIYRSPGVFDEKLYLYYATDLSFNRQHPDADEIIDYFEYNITDILHKIDVGEINDAKTLSAIFRAIRNGYLIYDKTCSN